MKSLMLAAALFCVLAGSARADQWASTKAEAQSQSCQPVIDIQAKMRDYDKACTDMSRTIWVHVCKGSIINGQLADDGVYPALVCDKSSSTLKAINHYKVRALWAVLIAALVLGLLYFFTIVRRMDAKVDALMARENNSEIKY